MNFIIAPHPDDEILGCGGVLLADPASFHVLYVTRGNREQEAVIPRISKALGFKASWLGFMECKMDELLGDIVGKLAATITDADTVYIPCINDYHSDHQVVARACRAALKPWKGKARRVYEYEVPSETPPGWIPTTYFPATARKAEVMREFYGAECIPSRNHAVIEALAVMRGAESGLGYAEAFRLVSERG